MCAIDEERQGHTVEPRAARITGGVVGFGSGVVAFVLAIVFSHVFADEDGNLPGNFVVGFFLAIIATVACFLFGCYSCSVYTKDF